VFCRLPGRGEDRFRQGFTKPDNAGPAQAATAATGRILRERNLSLLPLLAAGCTAPDPESPVQLQQVPGTDPLVESIYVLSDEGKALPRRLELFL